MLRKNIHFDPKILVREREVELKEQWILYTVTNKGACEWFVCN